MRAASMVSGRTCECVCATHIHVYTNSVCRATGPFLSCARTGLERDERKQTCFTFRIDSDKEQREIRPQCIRLPLTTSDDGQREREREEREMDASFS